MPTPPVVGKVETLAINKSRSFDGSMGLDTFIT